MNKAVFITGAQSGTGYGIAEHFAKQGCDVFITSRVGEEAEKAAAILAEEMQNAAQLSVPLKVDVNKGENWYVAKG